MRLEREIGRNLPSMPNETNDMKMNNKQLVDEMSQRIKAIMVAETENNIVSRFNQAKTIACLKAEFRVHDDIPEELKQGIFSRPATYPARLRFANATERDDSKKDIRGLSIRLSNVEGPGPLGASQASRIFC